VVLVGIVIAAVLLFKNIGSSEKTAKLEESPIKVAWNPPRDTSREEVRPMARQESAAPFSKQEALPPAAKNDSPEKPPMNPEPRRDGAEPNPLPVDSNQAIPAKLLEHLKSATVFVKVESKDFQASGSGFVMKVQGDTAYVVTNAHVIDPKIEIEFTVPRGSGPPFGMPQMPQMPRGPPNFPRGPFGPRGPMGPMGPRGPMTIRPPNFGNPPFGGDQTQKVVIPFGNATISLVFWSGTKREQSFRAEVTASDRQRDLAILKITGRGNLPDPIDCGQSPPLQETMPVFVFGFPFGESLSTNKGNPAITVGKGSVSSIRRDDKDELAYVQIDGALNPGNSGGPVVDSQGRLVGVAVKTIKGAGIGLAIPSNTLTKVLQNRAQAHDPAGGAAKNSASPARNSADSKPRKIFERQPRVFLCDLDEIDVKSGPWPVTKNGDLGDPEGRFIQVDGIRSPKGLSMHPPDRDYASISYRLDKQASLLKADVALNDSTTQVADAAVFEVWGDGKPLWHSLPVHNPRRTQKVKVDVSKVDVLELRVKAPNSHLGLHAVWFEPRLLQKPDTPDKN
jgi:S1-C subfamily serine protease